MTAHLSSARDVFFKIVGNMEQVMQGQSASIRKLLASFASGGHVLLEDYPGTGKTTLAKVLARSIDAEFKRIQFTPDLLPSDILGVSAFDQKQQTFNFHKGPIFTNILLADEINRASPRTQSALLEAMGERDKLPWRASNGIWIICFLSLPRKTRLNFEVPIRFRKRRWIVSHFNLPLVM